MVSFRGGTHWVGILAAALITISSCTTSNGPGSSTGPSSSAGVTGPGGTVTFRLTGDIGCYDPVKTATCGAYMGVVAAYDYLLASDSAGKLVPYLAQSWNATPTSITFTLRKDALCGDGTPVTPTVVKNSLQRLIDSKASFNGQNWGPGPYTVVADDGASTVTFTVGTPYSDLPYGFTFGSSSGTSTGIVCPAGIANPKLMDTQPAGSGPYKLGEAVAGDHFTWALRPEYAWGPFGITAKTAGVPETVIYKVVANNTTAANLFLTGGLDVGTMSGPDVARLAAEKSLTQKTNYNYVAIPLLFNELPGRPGADETIRRALITAIDPNAFMQAATQGRGKLSPSLFTPAANCFDPTTASLAPTPSVDGARSILQGAGWSLVNGKLTKNGQALTIKIVNDQRIPSGAEYLQASWTQMGATVVLSLTDTTAFVGSLLAGDFDATYLFVDSPLPILGQAAGRFIGPFPPQGTNFGRNSDTVLPQEAAAAQASVGAESCTHWAAFQQELWKHWHAMPLFAFPADWFSTKFDLSRVTGPISVPPLLLLRTAR